MNIFDQVLKLRFVSERFEVIVTRRVETFLALNGSAQPNDRFILLALRGIISGHRIHQLGRIVRITQLFFGSFDPLVRLLIVGPGCERASHQSQQHNRKRSRLHFPATLAVCEKECDLEFCPVPRYI